MHQAVFIRSAAVALLGPGPREMTVHANLYGKMRKYSGPRGVLVLHEIFSFPNNGIIICHGVSIYRIIGADRLQERYKGGRGKLIYRPSLDRPQYSPSQQRLAVDLISEIALGHSTFYSIGNRQLYLQIIPYIFDLGAFFMLVWDTRSKRHSENAAAWKRQRKRRWKINFSEWIYIANRQTAYNVQVAYNITLRLWLQLLPRK